MKAYSFIYQTPNPRYLFTIRDEETKICFRSRLTGHVCCHEMYGGPQLSQQQEIIHCQRKKLMAKRKSPLQKQIAHGKRRKLMTKRNRSQKKEKPHGKKERGMGVVKFTCIAQ